MALTHSWTLFGFDLRKLGGLWQQGWSEAAQWPLLRKLVQPLPVVVRHADGQYVRWIGDHAERLDGAVAKGPFQAFEMPPEAVLFRTLRLPPLTRSELEDAVALEVSAASPFAEADRVWGWRADPAGDGALAVTIAIAARAQAEEVLGTAGEASAEHYRPELWAFDAGRPVVLRGFGEARRRTAQRRCLYRDLLLLAVALGLVLVLAASPVLQARQQVFQAQDAFWKLHGETQDLVAARDRLVDQGARIRAVQAWLDNAPQPMPLLERLTALIPDDAYLTSLEIKRDTVIASGLAQNAAVLIESLGAQPGFVDLRPSGIARDRSSGLETFRVEFRVVAAEAPR